MKKENNYQTAYTQGEFWQNKPFESLKKENFDCRNMNVFDNNAYLYPEEKTETKNFFGFPGGCGYNTDCRRRPPIHHFPPPMPCHPPVPCAPCGNRNNFETGMFWFMCGYLIGRDTFC